MSLNNNTTKVLYQKINVDNDEVENLFNEILSKPGIEQVIICDTSQKILRTTMPLSQAREIVSGFFKAFQKITERLRKYGKGASKLISMRLYLDNYRYLYIIRGRKIITIILQKSEASPIEKFLINILRKIDKSIEEI
ncbi:MAG: hypothetical protein ACTSVA_01695 [Candidatus Njordarchaeales archaeon]